MSRQKSIGRGKNNKCKMVAILILNLLTTSHVHFILFNTIANKITTIVGRRLALQSTTGF